MKATFFIRLAALALCLFAGTAEATPLCVPGVYGTAFPGSRVVPFVKGVSGWYAYGWCQTSSGAPAALYRLCAASECPTSWAGIGTTLGAIAAEVPASGASAAYGGWWTSNPPDFNCDAVTGEQFVHQGSARATACLELLGLLERDKPAYTSPPAASAPPPTLVWKTPASGTYTLYVAAAGALKSIVAGRKATANAACDCTAKVMSGTSTYCPLVGAAPTEVTLCKQISQ